MKCAPGEREGEEDYSHLFFERPFVQVIWTSQQISWFEVTSDVTILVHLTYIYNTIVLITDPE